MVLYYYLLNKGEQHGNNHYKVGHLLPTKRAISSTVAGWAITEVFEGVERISNENLAGLKTCKVLAQNKTGVSK